MNIKEHRIYKHLGSPVKIAGLTIGEIFLCLGGLGVFLFVPTVSQKGLVVVSTIFMFWMQRHLKKKTSGFALKPFLHWHCGIRFNTSKEFPKPHHHFYKG